MFGFGKNSNTPLPPPAGGRSQQDDAPAFEERNLAWERALKSNTLPDFVAARLSDARTGKQPWLSTMTPAELRLSRSHGISPIATVTGTCWFHYGFSWTEGHAEGWRTALQRIKREAVLAGANAVVDVKLRRVQMDFDNSMDYTLIGTAVRIADLPPSTDPVVATVSALEFVRLLEAGIVTAGLAIGAAYRYFNSYGLGYLAYNASSNNSNAGLYRMLESYHMKEITDFWEMVRRRALTDLGQDARQHGNGVLAHTHFGQLLRIEQDKQPPAYLGRHIVIGTVVDTGDSRGFAPDIRMTLDMRDDDTFASRRDVKLMREEDGEI